MKRLYTIVCALLVSYQYTFARSFLEDSHGNGLDDDALRAGDVSLEDIPSTILALTNNLLELVGYLSIAMIVVGAIVYVFSGISGDKSKGQNIIFFAIIGALVSWSSWFLINFVIDNV